MSRSLVAANTALFTVPASLPAAFAAASAHAWPTKRAFYANHFYTGNEAMELTIFADSDIEINAAKSLCGSCPMKAACLEGAMSRLEPCGVWGGELIEDGVVIERKRRPGRPARVAA